MGTSVAGIEGGNGGWILVGVALIAALLFYAWALARAAAVTWPPPEDSSDAASELVAELEAPALRRAGPRGHDADVSGGLGLSCSH